MSAFRRSARVTQVSPWIVGGDGQLRDLFPIPPLLLLTFRAITTLVRHFLITTTLLLALYFWAAQDWAWWQAFLILPITVVLLRLTLITFYLWFKNPTIPLVARK